MELNEALRILIDEGMLVEKKYRTTPEERRQARLSAYGTYGSVTVEEKTKKIIEDAGLGEYFRKIEVNNDCLNINYDENENLDYLLKKLSKSFSFELKNYRNQPYMQFEFDLKSKLSQKKLEVSEAITQALKKRFGIPEDLLGWYNSCYLSSVGDIKRNYDKVERFIEVEQYGGIHDLNYKDFEKTVEAAFHWALSDKNQDKYIRNKYGFEKQIDEFYVEFRRLCKILSKELNRKRGKL